MKAGRNDPCPCGSGKKYKKCCLTRDQADAPMPTGAIPPPVHSHTRPEPAAFTRPAPVPPPPDPLTQRRDARWEEFESRTGGDRIAVFLDVLDDTLDGAAVVTDDLAFEMLSRIRTDGIESGNRARFAECVAALRARRPEVFDDGLHFYLSWSVVDALAEGRHEVVPALARELAVRAESQIDIFTRTTDALEYHGQLAALVEAQRIAWPDVKPSHDILPWAISEFAQKGVQYEIFDYLERTAAPDPADPVLLDRVRFYVEAPRVGYLHEFIGDLTGASPRAWQTDDFALSPPKSRSRDEWDDEDDGDDEPEHPPADPGAMNLSRLVSEFVGYLRRVEGVPFTRGELVCEALYRYFIRRNEESHDPRPDMLRRAMNPQRKLSKPSRPAHPLCPDRGTLDVHLGGMVGMLNDQHHSGAALFQAVPAWLRFLESRRLIDADTRQKVATELLPLHATLLKLWERYTEDPTLYRQGQAWPADAAKGPPETAANDPAPPRLPDDTATS